MQFFEEALHCLWVAGGSVTDASFYISICNLLIPFPYDGDK